MRQTLIVTSSNRAMDRETYDSIAQLMKLGARHVRQAGSADVTFARNAALSMACHASRLVKDTAPVETVLMIDDDMVFGAVDAAKLVEESRARGVPCSALYVTINQIPACHAWKKADDGKQLWLVGLGLLAIPLQLLLELELDAVPFQYKEEPTYREFCRSGVIDGLWVSEDYSLCEALGGVHLLPIEAGHRKPVTLWPNESTLKELADADR